MYNVDAYPSDKSKTTLDIGFQASGASNNVYVADMYVCYTAICVNVNVDPRIRGGKHILRILRWREGKVYEADCGVWSILSLLSRLMMDGGGSVIYLFVGEGRMCRFEEKMHHA